MILKGFTRQVMTAKGQNRKEIAKKTIEDNKVKTIPRIKRHKHTYRIKFDSFKIRKNP